MLRAIRILLLCLTLPALAHAELPTWQQHPSKNKPREHVMVQFTDMSLHPSIAQVLAGGKVSWVNYGTMYQGSIVISDEVAAAFTCSELGPRWLKTATGYQSVPISEGGPMNDLPTPCPLKKGEYEYEIWLFTSTFGGPGAMGDPQARMQGKIIAE
jgi:hypothetical protein